MPEGTAQLSPSAEVIAGGAPPVRHDRPHLMAFVTDAESEEALRNGLSDLLPAVPDIRRGGVRAARIAMQKTSTPRILVVDVTEEGQPLQALADLAGVVEPDVCVLVIGEIDGAEFYREVTRGLGASDYLAKPLTRDRVSRHFGNFVLGKASSGHAVLGGRVLTVTGARGGVGSSTVAANLAWYLGVSLRHHTVLFDPDLYSGNAAFLFNLHPGNGLRTAIESPERIDALLAERAAQPAAERLHVLGGEEALAVRPNYAPGAAEHLIEALRRRYNFIIVDLPFAPTGLFRELFDLAHQHILVLDPTLASLRDTLRLLTVPGGAAQTDGTITVMNRLGLPGGLTRRQVDEGLKRKVDVVIPDLPRQLRTAANLGEPALTSSTAYRKAITSLAEQVAALNLINAPATVDDAAGSTSRSRWFTWRKAK